MKVAPSALSTALLGLSTLATIRASPITIKDTTSQPHTLSPPSSDLSIAHDPSFPSLSFEPAFWVEFFGNLTHPNALTFSLLSLIHTHGGRPLIRPGGITMDSMIFSPCAGDPVRDTSRTGGVYRTTVGPDYYRSWDHFPEGMRFVSTLNFGNDSLEIAEGLAGASVKYQSGRLEYFELGNEPTNYPAARWGNSTEAYVAQWKNWTAAIDHVVNRTLQSQQIEGEENELGRRRWWASSATTDNTSLNVRPSDLIPLGIDSNHTVAQYSIHSYPFATCDPTRAALATLPNLLNHTHLAFYADTEILPSALAALESGRQWVVGEFNSVACSGQPNVTDTFAQALWVVDTELIYAVRNASSVHLHQGATLVFQSSDQVNQAGEDGKPGFSTYDFVYPQISAKRGVARALPSFVAQLFLAEAFWGGEAGYRVAALPTPDGVDGDGFAGYAFYDASTGGLAKVALLNMKPLYTEDRRGLKLNLSSLLDDAATTHRATVKRLTAPKVDEKDSDKVAWAGQSFTNGTAHGRVQVKRLGHDATIFLRDSEAALISFDP